MVISKIKRMSQLERDVRMYLLQFCGEFNEVRIPAHKLLQYSKLQILNTFDKEYEISFLQSHTVFKDKIVLKGERSESPSFATCEN